MQGKIRPTSLDNVLLTVISMFSHAKVYEKAYGEKADVSALIPSMLVSFLASDAGFKKAKRELA